MLNYLIVSVILSVVEGSLPLYISEEEMLRLRSA